MWPYIKTNMPAITDIMNNGMGATVVSIIMGLGLAALFRKVCDDKKCVVVHSPNNADMENYYYQVQGECYKYTPESAPCTK